MPVPGNLIDALRSTLQSPEKIAADSFVVARNLCAACADSDSPDGQELLLRALEHRSAFGDSAKILDGLVRHMGLFPYLDPEQLALSDRIAYEAHRATGLEADDVIFHRAQAEVFHLLMSGRNVALSAPTSFGKSLLIDAVIASGKFSNVAIVVPTIALIDETRRRLTRRFRDKFKIITHLSQRRAERNVFIFTQERILDAGDWSGLDFFVIDEFYKLTPDRGDSDRSTLLNQAFYQLAKTGAQFYMLGPSIGGFTDQVRVRIEADFKHLPYQTVAAEIHRLDADVDDIPALVSLCESLRDPTIVYCRSPSRAADVANALTSAGVGSQSAILNEAADWIGWTYHSGTSPSHSAAESPYITAGFHGPSHSSLCDCSTMVFFVTWFARQH